MEPEEVEERLRFIVQEAKRVERHARILKQQSAQLIESMAEEVNSQEAHDGSKQDTHD
jgi:hypothetical protein